MTLDVVRVSEQVAGMAGNLRARALKMSAVPAFADELLRAWHGRPDEAQDYLESVGQSGVWPIAVPLEPLRTARPAAPEPANYAVLASDGSQIEADGHGLVQCFLVNVGWAGIAYGATPAAWLASEPRVYYRDDEVYMDADDGMRQEVGDHLLAMLRTVAELERLAGLVEQWRGRANLVAVADGNLVRWEMGGKRPDPARIALLRRYVAALARFRALDVPVCSYISRPNAREVANAAHLLALRDCESSGSGCSRCVGRADRLCDDLRLLTDRELLAHLRVGERSALFCSLAPVLREYHQQDQILFWYLHTGDEMARIEVPVWAAVPDKLDLIQSVLMGQCTRGHGYPVVLTEAHEQAVIHSGARTAFKQLIQEALNSNALAAAVSAKRLSKDQRAV